MDIDVIEIINTGLLVGGTLSVFSFFIGFGIYTMLSTFKHIINTK